MRICLLGPTWPYRGGISHFTTLLARALDATGQDVHLFSYARQYPRFLYPGRDEEEVGETAPRFAPVEYLLDSVSPVSWLRTATRIRALRPDCLILQWWTAFWTAHHLSLAGLLRSRRRPALVTICHNATDHDPSVWKLLATRLALAPSDLVMAHSRGDHEELVRVLDERRVVPAFHPTYAAFAEDADVPPRPAARLTLGLPADAPVLLFFGFVRRYKGLDLLLDALAILRRRVPAVLLVAGEFWGEKGPYEEQIERLGLEDAVVLHDRYVPVDELPLYFRSADLAVFPYRTATQSGAAQMAAGFGCPYIASDAGGLGEGNGDHRDHLFPTGDVDALASRLEGALNGTLTIAPRPAPSFEEYARLLVSSVESLAR